MLDHIYPIEFIRKKPFFTFLLGVTYSLLGIVTAKLLFPSDPGLMSLAFTTLLLFPSLMTLISIEEETAILSTERSLRGLWKRHKDIFAIMFFIFLGIMLTFSFFSAILPKSFVNYLFKPQISVLTPRGMAASGQSFFGYVSHNVWVMLIIFLLSIIYGAGSVLVVVWNASAWGAIFGYYTQLNSKNPLAYLIILLISVFMHTFMEAGAYFIAAIAGAVISRAIINRKLRPERFNIILFDGLTLVIIALLLIIVAALVESYVTPTLLHQLTILAKNVGII